MNNAMEMLNGLITKLETRRGKALAEAERAKGWVRHYGGTYSISKLDINEAAKWLKICKESFDEAEMLLGIIGQLSAIKKAMEVDA